MSLSEQVDHLLTLSLVPPGQRVRVLDVRADQKTSHRLSELVLCGAQRCALYRMTAVRC
ncbi:MAG: hypothetical protein HC893_10505 [Chloroflexaceae bacterium]|nr:hypothetical protein [Chloroflexaceae bacterium]